MDGLQYLKGVFYHIKKYLHSGRTVIEDLDYIYPNPDREKKFHIYRFLFYFCPVYTALERTDC